MARLSKREDQQIEIRGDGLFGYNDHGTCEGEFTSPPTILLDRMPDRDQSKAVKDQTVEEWQAHMAKIAVQPSLQYLRAMRGQEPDEMVKIAEPD